jgi:hypothetical protein
MLRSISKFNNFFLYERENKYNHLALGIVALLGHIFLGLYWRYIDQMPYEGLALRGLGALICIGLIYFTTRDVISKLFLSWYWIFAVIYNLPFFFTVSLIRNGFLDVWYIGEATMIFVVMLFLKISILISLLVLFAIPLLTLLIFYQYPSSERNRL